MQSLLCAAWLLSVAAAPGHGGPPLRRYEQAQPHMGARFEIVVYSDDEGLAKRGIAAAFKRIAELNEKLSDYLVDSELSRLSQAAPTAEPVKLSNDLYRVLRVSQDLSRQTGGAFDITVGPLTKLWRRARRRKQLPAAERLAEAKRSVGFQFLVLDDAARTAELRRPNMRLDLGGIAKGFAADEALDELAAMGLTRALVNAGGDVVAREAPPGDNGWRIGIAPLNSDSEPSRIVRLREAAVATSGDARQFVEIDGRRYSHILDPKTGYGLTERSSVTVMAPSGMLADALASAVSVMGPERGLELIETMPSVEALVVRLENDIVRTYASSGFGD